MSDTRLHNFSAGPAVLPLQVVRELQEQLPNLHGSGVGLMEISHRSKTFDDIMVSAMRRLRRVMGIPADYTVLFLQGGASTQFAMMPANLLQGGVADYLDTGTWAAKAAVEVSRFGEAVVPFSDKERGYCAVPTTWDSTPDAVYTHYTSNNTVAGTQFPGTPQVDGRLVCDMSSDIASRPVDVARHELIYAGAQKNLGPSGVTVIVLSPWAIEQSRRADVPTMWSYAVHADKRSLFNTPNTLGVFVLERVLAWVEQEGIDVISERNRRKAQKLYTLLDSSDFWQPRAAAGSRSDMNVTWRLADRALEPKMVEQGLQARLSGLKGHRSVGGLRASLYNACPEASVDSLVDFLKDFERRLG